MSGALEVLGVKYGPVSVWSSEIVAATLIFVREFTRVVTE
jgi:hypothetical protein